MKGFRYILFTSIMFLLFINVTNAATCAFGTESLYFECSTTSSGVDCTIDGTNSNNLEFAAPVGPQTVGHEIEINTSVVENCNDNSRIYAVINYRTNEVLGLYSEEPIVNNVNASVMPLTKLDDESYEEVNTDLSAYNGNACVYTSGVFKYVCTISNGRPVCELGCADGSLCGDNYNYSSANQTLTAADFLNGRNFSCTKNGNTLHVCVVNDGSGKTNVTSVGTECSGSGLTITYSSNANDFEGNPGYNEDEDGENFGGDREEAGGGRPEDVVNDAQNDNEVVENFCAGSRLGVFTTIGWVFWIAKILVPIVLIALGCIDLGKAVIASKDDEIKKSVKTLVIRIVAGIIIFFVPTLINLVVNLINGSDVYTGEDFGTCTHCLLVPTDPNCPGLRGE